MNYAGCMKLVLPENVYGVRILAGQPRQECGA